MADRDALKKMREKSLKDTKDRMKKSIGKDKIVVQAVNAIDDLADVSNLLSERLHEWYGLHHPEYKKAENKKYAEGIVKGTEERKTSTGIDLESDDLKAIIQHANLTKGSFQLREDLEDYVSDQMGKIAPNISTVIGPVMGARLMAIAGGLEKLAKMPASTIQLLGAEKALFRFIKEQKKVGNPPKYGIIFTHELIQQAKPAQRGKVARLLSAKIAMAAKTDFYSKEDKSEWYKKELEKKLKELK